MTIKNTLTSIVLTGAMALGISGCEGIVPNGQYSYDGKINEDRVKFSTVNTLRGYNNTLTVKKSDGRIIVYEDTFNNDLKLESVVIIKEGLTEKQAHTYTSNDEVGKVVLVEAQKQFDSYLGKIKEARLVQGSNDLK